MFAQSASDNTQLLPRNIQKIILYTSHNAIIEIHAGLQAESEDYIRSYAAVKFLSNRASSLVCK